MNLKTTLTLLLISLSLTSLFGQQTREVINTSTKQHSIYKVNGVAFVDDETKPFTGQFIELRQDGQKKSQYNYINGKLEGEFFEWSSKDGVLYVSKHGTYKNDKLNGDFFEMWRINHKKQECTYKNGELDGKLITYEGFQVEEPKFIGFFKMGKKDSTQTWFFEGGKPSTIERWKNGQQNGLQVSYYSSGQIQSETNYVANKKSGTAKSYFENGQISHIAKYINDLLDGEELFYFENGKIKERRNYKLGKKFGKFEWYNEDGSIKEETEYKL
jgi:uncharacterized protein